MDVSAIPGILQELGGTDQARAFKAAQALRFACYGLADPAKARERAAFAAALAAELNATVTPAPKNEKNDPNARPQPVPKYETKVRNSLLRALALVGGEAEVPEIARTLRDLDLREMARYALERNPSKAATAALIAAVDASGPEFRIGVINALAKRPAADVLATLRGLTGDDDPEVRLAAVEALAGFAQPDSDAVMAVAARRFSGRQRDRVAKARLRLAETLRDHGDKVSARQILQRVARELPLRKDTIDAWAKSLE